MTLEFEKQIELMKKCEQVAAGCKTADQKLVANAYIRLALKTISNREIYQHVKQLVYGMYKTHEVNY